MAVLARGLHLALRTTRTDAFKPMLTEMISSAYDPNLLTPDNFHSLSLDSLKETIRSRMETLYHPTSTARMAPLERGGVVDAKLRVHGVDNLRVVDASIFPNIMSGHTVSFPVHFHLAG